MAVSPLMDEVTVTARRREENLQTTPISISAFTGESLKYRGVTQLDQIDQFTPNLTFQNNPSFGGASSAAAIYIRGVGQKEFLPTTEPGVGLYVDDVYVARSVGAILDLIDIERVEVLRGPQGTLFGRNTIGGAINVVSKKPQAELGGKLELTGGTSERRDVRASVNLPFTDNFFSRFSFGSFQRDGYVVREDGIDLGDEDVITGRAAFRWLPTDTLELNLSIDGTRERENGPALSLLGIDWEGNPGNNFAIFHNFATEQGNPGIGCFPPPWGDLANSACYNEQFLTDDDKDAGTGVAFSNTDLLATNFTLDWAITDQLDFRSITGYRDLDSEFARDGDHSPHTVVHFHDTLEQDQITQEFQFLGSHVDARINWIVGFYYFKEKGDNVNTLNFSPVDFRSGGQFDNESIAGFAQSTFDITEKLGLTLGLRYTTETKGFNPDQVIYVNRTPDPSLDPGTRVLPPGWVEESGDAWTPLVNLAYQWTDDFMLYGTYSEGFKSGGFVQRVFPPLTEVPSYDPEYVNNYEIGFKLSNADGRLRFNGAFFYMDYEDMQIQVFNGVAPITQNAASAHIQGFEFELAAVPFDYWFLEASVGYLDPEYDDIDDAATEVSKDNEFERVSKWNLSAALSWQIPAGKVGEFIPRVDWAYRSKFYNDALNTEQIAQDGYNVVNANLAWETPVEGLRTVLGVTNLTDEQYLQTGVYGTSFRQYEGMYARGREYYITLGYEF